MFFLLADRWAWRNSDAEKRYGESIRSDTPESHQISRPFMRPDSLPWYAKLDGEHIPIGKDRTLYCIARYLESLEKCTGRPETGVEHNASSPGTQAWAQPGRRLAMPASARYRAGGAFAARGGDRT